MSGLLSSYRHVSFALVCAVVVVVIVVRVWHSADVVLGDSMSAIATPCRDGCMHGEGSTR